MGLVYEIDGVHEFYNTRYRVRFGQSSGGIVRLKYKEKLIFSVNFLRRYEPIAIQI